MKITCLEAPQTLAVTTLEYWHVVRRWRETRSEVDRHVLYLMSQRSWVSQKIRLTIQKNLGITHDNGKAS